MNDIEAVAIEYEAIAARLRQHAADNTAIDSQLAIDARDAYVKVDRLYQGKSATSKHDGYKVKP